MRDEVYEDKVQLSVNEIARTKKMLDDNRSSYLQSVESKSKDIIRMNKKMETLAQREKSFVEKLSNTSLTQKNAISNLKRIADKSSKGSSIIYITNLTPSIPKSPISPGYIRMVENS